MYPPTFYDITVVSTTGLIYVAYPQIEYIEWTLIRS